MYTFICICEWHYQLLQAKKMKDDYDSFLSGLQSRAKGVREELVGKLSVSQKAQVQLSRSLSVVRSLPRMCACARVCALSLSLFLSVSFFLFLCLSVSVTLSLFLFLSLFLRSLAWSDCQVVCESKGAGIISLSLLSRIHSFSFSLALAFKFTLALALTRILLHSVSRARAHFFAQFCGQIEDVRQKEQTEILESQLFAKWTKQLECESKAAGIIALSRSLSFSLALVLSLSLSLSPSNWLSLSHSLAFSCTLSLARVLAFLLNIVGKSRVWGKRSKQKFLKVSSLLNGYTTWM